MTTRSATTRSATTRSAAPGPARQLRRCDHAVLPLLAALLLATPATAQIIPTGSPAADILLSTAITEQRALLTCSALDPARHQNALTLWQQDVAAAITVMAENGVPPAAITTFQDAASAANLLPAEDTPFAAVQAYCQGQDDWPARLDLRDVTNLGRALPGAFE
jgi:hypothetical protein